MPSAPGTGHVVAGAGKHPRWHRPSAPEGASGASVEIRPMGRQDRDALIDLDQWAFGFDTEGTDFDALMGPMEWDRIFGAYLPAPDHLAGINATYSLDLPVPGGHVPCAGLTWVGVHPGDRRRGV